MHLAQRFPSMWSKPGVTLTVLEIVNYRLLTLYRYHGKHKSFMYDVTKIVSTLKGKRGDHRVFRLAENLCMNLILSIRDFFSLKREGKGPTEFTETLNRTVIVTLAIIIKTRGISDPDHFLCLQSMIEQITATSQHMWSNKTLHYFPPILREALIGRTDNTIQAIQAWQQVETTVINQCTQLLSPSADPTYVTTYISHSFPQHRQYLCAGAWRLMQGHPENINCSNLAHVLREFSPEEVTANIYTLVDVVLHLVHLDIQHGSSLQDVLLRTSANLSIFVWNHDLIPLDILLLALSDRDDDPHALPIVISLLDKQELEQRIRLFCLNRGPPEHWNFSGVFKRVELQKALGGHLSWKDRFPTFFDDIVARLIPVIPLIVFRLIENDVMDMADRILSVFSPLLSYHPLRFTLVRDILAYFYGHLPPKLIVRILHILDLNKIPFSESFPQYITSCSQATSPPTEYFVTILLGLVNTVIPPLHMPPKPADGEGSDHSVPFSNGSKSSTSHLPPKGAPDEYKRFYKIQDPGSHSQLMLDTCVIELLSLPIPASQIMASFIGIFTNLQLDIAQCFNYQVAALPPGAAHGSLPGLSSRGSETRSSSSVFEVYRNFARQSGYTCMEASCLMIQAGGLLLAQLPPDFHVHVYLEASHVLKDHWWISDDKQCNVVGTILSDPARACADGTSTAIGNIVALLHSFFSNLPQEWLESSHVIVNQLRPISSVALLRLVFRIMGPLLPRVANAHTLFNKTLQLLMNAIADVFGKNVQPSSPVEATEITDIIDFIHHIVHYEGQGGPVQASTKPRLEVLVLCGRVVENLRPDVQLLLSHLKPDINTSIYAASYPNLTTSVT